MLAPQLSRLRQASAEGQIDVLVVASADRIDDLPAWQVVIIMELDKYNVRVESALERNGTHLILEQIIKDTDEAVAQIKRERAASSQHNKSRRKKGGQGIHLGDRGARVRASSSRRGLDGAPTARSKGEAQEEEQAQCRDQQGSRFSH